MHLCANVLFLGILVHNLRNMTYSDTPDNQLKLVTIENI